MSVDQTSILEREVEAAVYERRLDDDLDYAMEEAGRYFEQRSEVNAALKRITQRLGEMGIDYAVVGALALFHHGYRRTTDDVDLLVTPENLRRIHEHLEGRGYMPVFEGSKHLRDTRAGVKIEFITTGDYPGDGKAKPIAFPDPEDVVVEREGLRIMNLPTLVSLKLASGSSAAHRERDLVDVQALIEAAGLGRDFVSHLPQAVRGAYLECWQKTRRRFCRDWVLPRQTPTAHNIHELATAMRAVDKHEPAQTLERMAEDGVWLETIPNEPSSETSSRTVRLVTENPAIARKHEMHEETDFWR